MDIGLGHYLAVAAALFTIGILGIFINRKNVIVILMSIELILLSVNINLVAFSSFLGDLTGQVFALLVLTVAAAEAAIGLAMAPSLSRKTRHIATKFHYTKSLVAKGVIAPTYIDTLLNHADMISKAKFPWCACMLE